MEHEKTQLETYIQSELAQSTNMTNMFRDELEKRLGELTATIGERNALQGVVEELHQQLGVVKDTMARQEVGCCRVAICRSSDLFQSSLLTVSYSH